MVTKLQNVKNPYPQNPVTTNPVATSASDIIPIGQSKNPENSQGPLNSNNISNTNTQNQNLRSKKQLLDSLKFLQQYGITEEQGIEILCAMGFNCNEKNLLNMNQKDFNKQIKIIQDTLVALQEDGIEVNKENLAKHASKYASQINCGWKSVSSFRENKYHESITDKLRKAYGDKFITGNKEDLVKGVEAYYSEIKGATQISDFSKLLYYSTDEEIEILYNAIPYLEKNDKLKGVVAALKSCSTPEMQSKIASNYEVNEKIMTSVDKNGEFLSREEMQELSTGLATYRNFKDAMEYNKKTEEDYKEFFAQKDIKQTIDAIIKKSNNNEPLTEEEQELLNKYNQIIAEPAGQFVGYGNSNILSSSEKSSVLTELNDIVYDYPVYREVMTEVINYTQKHPETLSMSSEEFAELMESVTNGNYTTITNDIQNGTYSELAAPSVPSTSNNSYTNIENNTPPTNNTIPSNNFGVQNEILDNISPHERTVSVQELYNTPYENDTKKDKTDSILYSKELNMTKFLEYIHDKGVFNTVYEIYSNISNVTNQFIINSGKKLYKILPPDLQEKILRNVNSSDSFVDLLKETNDIVVLELKPNFSNSNKNKILEEAQREAKERLKKYEDTKIA